jgi:hypothetical protein
MLPAELHWRRVADRVIVVFGLPASAGVFAWVVWNWVIFGSPFYFQFGPFSRPALWTPSTDPAVHHWGVAAATYWYAMQDILGRPTLLLSVIGVGLMLVVQWRKGEFVNALPALSLLIMVPFFVVMLYTGQRPMHVTQVSPRLSLYNVRFALIMLTPVAISIGYLAGLIEGYWTGVGVRWSAPVVAGVMLVGVAGIAAWSLMSRDPGKAFRPPVTSMPWSTT